MKLSFGEILAKFARARAVRAIALGLAAAVAATTLPAATPASAHGERSQQAFLRMRTLNWYDVKWSKTELNVNEEMELTGKVHVFSGWPQAVAKPGNRVPQCRRAGAGSDPQGLVHRRRSCSALLLDGGRQGL